METKANYVLVGVFTVVILVLSFGFVYWSANVSDKDTQVRMLVRIEGSVTGLSVGSQVLFNGLRVGDVRNLRIDPNDPRVVIAATQVDATTPITTSTRATIGFAGLTGQAFIELKGGDVTERNIIAYAQEQGAVPVIKADPSDVTDILATAKDIAERANNILTQFEAVAKDIQPAVRTTASNITATSENVRVFTDSLAANSGQIDEFLSSISRLAGTANTVAEALPEAIQSAQSVIQAVDPRSVRTTVDNVAAISQTLRAQSEKVGSVVSSVQTAADSLGSVGEAIGRNSPAIDRFLANLGPISETATSVATRLDTALGEANEILAAVDPQSMRTTVDNVAAISGTLREQSGKVASVIGSVQTAADNLGPVSEAIGRNSPAIDRFLASLGPISDTATSVATRLDTALGETNEILAAVDPDQVRATLGHVSGAAEQVSRVASTIGDQSGEIRRAIAGFVEVVDNVDRITDSVAANSQTIGEFLSGVGPLTKNANAALTSFNDTLGSANRVISAVDPADVRTAVANISGIASTINGQGPALGEAISNASGAIRNVNELTASFAAKRETIDRFLDQLGPIGTNAARASQRISDAADGANQVIAGANQVISGIDRKRVSETVDNLAALTAGLSAKTPEIQSIIDGVDRTIRTVDTTLTGLDGTRERVDGILAGIDPAEVNRAVTNVSSATDNVARAADSIASIANDIGTRRDDINRIITNAEAASAKVNTASGRLDTVLASVDRLLRADSTEGLAKEASATLAAIRETAANINARVGPIADNIQSFSGNGLREVRTLVRDVTRSVNRIEGAVSDFQSNPSRIIFGGDEVKQYNGRTRR